MSKSYKYEMSQDVVNYILQALNSVQISGVQQAQHLLKVTDILQNPTNAGELEKEQLETLKAKYEKPKK